MKYRILATDFDGTIFPHTTYVVPQSVTEALQRYISAGGRVLITTGRMFKAVLPYVRGMGLKGEILCLQGAVCCRIEDESEVFSLGLSFENTMKLVKYIEEKGWIFQFYHDIQMYTQQENPYSDLYANICKIQPVYTRKKVSEYIKENGFCAQKIIVMSPSDETGERIAQIKAKFPNFDVTQSTPEYIEIVDGGSGKGNAVKRFAEMVGVPLSQVAAFGDETNDLSMLKTVGFSAAPQNAVPKVKAAVDMIYKDVSLGGAAEVIDMLTKDEIK